ncbi:MAG: Crp/Fnr family transcriptional regulator [Burkholderiales bacterium]|nr:Crp/Fnr family transcriptional regulator [Burkholderiales bacterium]
MPAATDPSATQPTATDPTATLAKALGAALGADAAREAVPSVAAGLAPLFTPHTIERGAPLLRPGERWSHALLVGSGLLRLYFLRRDGREFNKNFVAEGGLLCPITPAMWGQPSLFSIAAVERTRLWRCDATRWREALAAAGLWAPLQRELLQGLLSAKLQREHDLLALTGRQRYEAFCQRFPALAERVPLLHLASYLGLTDVSLSRLRRGLREPPTGAAPQH